MDPYFGDTPPIQRTFSGNFRPQTRLPSPSLYNPLFAAPYMPKPGEPVSPRTAAARAAEMGGSSDWL